MATRIIEKFYENPEYLTINMGPQHPSTHGVLRLIVELDGEMVVSLKPVVGYLHRAKEKLAEVKTYNQWIPYTDRMDYLAPMSNNYGWVATVEKLMQIEVTEKCLYLRTILVELARISSHLLWLGAHALELGAMTVFLYTFRERETIYDFFEQISGARFTVSYMRVGGVARPVPDGWLDAVCAFTKSFPGNVQEYEDLLTENEIFIQRTKDVGTISAQDAIDLGLSGPSLRASGVEWDIRKSEPYLVYDRLMWKVPIGEAGDTYERYLLRMEEMRQSCSIIEQCLDEFPISGPLNIDNPKVILPERELLHKSMETLIHHFLLASEGLQVPPGEVYFAIEAPKGELGYYLYSAGGAKPYRVKVRSPSFTNLQSFEKMCVGRTLADVVAVIGGLDIVMGDVDR